MRIADSGYICNLTTKPLAIGKDYTIRIGLDGPTREITLEAVISAKGVGVATT